MTIHSLSTILQAGNPECLVAWDSDTRYTQADFLHAVNTLHNSLISRSEKRWLLVHDDTYRFAVGLFALLAAGKEVLLPPNAQTGTLSDLMQQADAFLSEEMFSCCETNSQKQTDDVLPLPDFDTLDIDALGITLLTSGSTGEPKAIRKTLRCLDAEIRTLEALWGERLGNNTAILATVSHQHIYGLLFRLLWPLCAGRAFAAHTHQYPEQLIAEVLKPVALISSPSQLKRFPPAIDMAAAQPHLVAVFSSGGLLPLEAAQDWQTRLQHTPIEILGSTETGGVAWRCQTSGKEHGANTPWQPLPSVQITTDDEQNLLVQSPFTGSSNPLAMGDRATLQADGNFQLLGRADRLVKIEEKRLSLTSMEQHLLTSPLVEAAHVLLLPKSSGRLGAVVLLTMEGKHLLLAQGKHALNQQLREHLLAHFERILLPRKWRFPEELPADTQGKITQAALSGLFDNVIGPPAGYSLQVLEHSADCKRVQISLSADSSLFDGHFPGLPILPGVVQFDLAVRQCADWYPLNYFRRIEKLKFQEPVVPGDCITLTLQQLGSGHVAFRYSLDDKPLSSGKIVFIEPT
ncbi:MAG TPA: AMP-binding protein [Pseudomonadales bacterium]|nr:AMP-binding protein [Pseudomonadales bacterium]